MADHAERFFHHFVAELKAKGYRADQAQQWLWRPRAVADLAITGAARDRDLSKLALDASTFEQVWQATPAAEAGAIPSMGSNTVLVLMPGFTHETLRNFSWHEQINRKDSPHEIRMLSPAANPAAATTEEVKASGRADGMKLLYVRYPRSNAASAQVLPGVFDLLSRSDSLKRWVGEGRRVLFVGYSYGAPLSLELLAGLNSGRFDAPWLLQATQGFLGLCGDIGGSYLADDVLKDDAQLFSLKKALAFCRRWPLVAKLAGLGTEQLMADIEGGVQALGHEARQAAIADYAAKLPAHVHYFTVAAVLPLGDYRRRWWQFNLDDYAMYRQALVSDPISLYNDGQVVLSDNLLPDAPQVPSAQRIHLGQVRTHHWGVSYKTFNLGNNGFPRAAFYRALMRSVAEVLAKT